MVRNGMGVRLRPADVAEVGGGVATEVVVAPISDMAGQRTDRVGSATAMGQTVSVVEKPTARPGVFRFELNRSLTGMGHERYRAGADISGDRPPDVVARRLLDLGGIEAVHVFSNQVTVELSPFGTTDGIVDLLKGLYTHYLEGVEPKKFG